MSSPFDLDSLQENGFCGRQIKGLNIKSDKVIKVINDLCSMNLQDQKSVLFKYINNNL